MKQNSKPKWNPFIAMLCWWKRFIHIKPYGKKSPKINHNVVPKQKIEPASPEKEAQKDFINEGGNSQPLK